MVFPTLDDLEASRDGRYEGIGYGLHGLPTVTDLQVAVAALEGGHRAFAVPSGLTATTLPLLALLSAGDRVLITDSVYGPTRRFATNTLRRMGIEVDYYDPLAGAGIEASMTANTKRRVRRVARLALLRRAGRAGDRGGRASPRRDRRDGQLLGDAARLPLVRPRRRRLRARGDQVHRRALGRAARAHRLQRGDDRAHPSQLDRHGRHRVVRRRVPRPARPAHAGDPPRAARGECAAHRGLAARARRGARGALPGAARRAWARPVEARLPARERALLDRARPAVRPRGASRACSTACGSSAWAGAGAATRA